MVNVCDIGPRGKESCKKGSERFLRYAIARINTQSSIETMTTPSEIIKNRSDPFFASNSHRSKTAININCFARNEASCGFRQQEQGRSDQFVGLPETVHRGVAHDVFDAVGAEDLAILLGR